MGCRWLTCKLQGSKTRACCFAPGWALPGSVRTPALGYHGCARCFHLFLADFNLCASALTEASRSAILAYVQRPVLV